MHASNLIFAAVVMLATLSVDANATTSSRSSIIRGRSVVHYGDLDLDTERGARAMLLRIQQAAKKACGGHATFSSYTGSLDNTFEECRSDAIQRTVKQLDAAMVTRIYSDAGTRR
jgi:UrcA family protein